MTLLRSALFLLWFAVLSTVMSIVFFPVMLLPPSATVWMSRRWCAATLWGLKFFAKIDFELRGPLPPRGVLVAAKHMSMWDTLAFNLVLGGPAFVLKRELLRVPFFGWYLWKAGMIAIDRSAGPSALRKMTVAARQAFARHRSVLIFPEGTRKKPGDPPDYKPGVAGLYGQLGVVCVPVALNSGLFWTGFVKKPGTIRIEFLEPIPPGLKRPAFMEILETRIETGTRALIAEGQRSA
jgi:1-acyl-sn-glycerol-3-phosphate acyltransferase